jgi:hypothetical protein
MHNEQSRGHRLEHHDNLLARRRGDRPGKHDQVPARRRGAAGIGLSTTIKYLRRSTSGTANNGLCAKIKYLRGAAGIGLGTTIKYLRRTTSAVANMPRKPKRGRVQQLGQGPHTQKLGTNSNEPSVV